MEIHNCNSHSREPKVKQTIPASLLAQQQQLQLTRERNELGRHITTTCKLRRQESSSKMLNVGGNNSNSGEDVELPRRYWLKNRRPGFDEEGDAGSADAWNQRIEDGNVALCWIKTELSRMRREDQSLARQFIFLRSTIRHMCSAHATNGAPSQLSRTSSCSSVEDAGIFGGSSLSCSSGDGSSVTSTNSSALKDNDFAGGEFRSRTQSLLERRGHDSPLLSLRRTVLTRSKEVF